MGWERTGDIIARESVVAPKIIGKLAIVLVKKDSDGIIHLKVN
jgi:hypothetical protein